MATPLMEDAIQAQYGTIATFRLKPGAEAALAETTKAWQDSNKHTAPSGFIGQYVYRHGAGDLYSMVVIFATKAEYEANSKTPEQHERYQEFRTFLQADPEWHDGDIVMAVTA